MSPARLAHRIAYSLTILLVVSLCTLTYHRNSITLTYSSGFPLNYEALYNYGCTAVAFYRNTGRGGACWWRGVVLCFIRQLANIPSYSYNKQQWQDTMSCQATTEPRWRIGAYASVLTTCIKNSLEYPIVLLHSTAPRHQQAAPLPSVIKYNPNLYHHSCISFTKIITP